MENERFERLKDYLRATNAIPELVEDLKLIERKYNSLKAQNRVHMMYLSQAPTINVYYDKPGEGGTQE